MRKTYSITVQNTSEEPRGFCLLEANEILLGRDYVDKEKIAKTLQQRNPDITFEMVDSDFDYIDFLWLIKNNPFKLKAVSCDREWCYFFTMVGCRVGVFRMGTAIPNPFPESDDWADSYFGYYEVNADSFVKPCVAAIGDDDWMLEPKEKILIEIEVASEADIKNHIPIPHPSSKTHLPENK